MSRSRTTALLAVGLTIALVGVLVSPTGAQPPPSGPRFDESFETPVLDLTTVPRRHHLLAADAGQGIVSVGRSGSDLVTFLPGVSDVVAVNSNRLFALTGEPPPEEELPPPDALQGAPSPPQTLYAVRARAGTVKAVVDFLEAENRFNPDGAQIESNPHSVAKNGRFFYVADAAANAVWVATRSGKVRPMATLPGQTVMTQWLKDAVGCPEAPPESADLCDLPPEMPAESVPTSVAIGPDGHVYVGELMGFPAPPGSSRVWRIDPSARFADCAVSDLCEVVLEGLTSIVDIEFTSGGDLVVAQMDEATFLAAEAGQGIGGAVTVCVIASGDCTDMANGLQLLTAIAVGRGDRVFAVVFGLVPGLADVVLVGRA